jgi:hypothetical protein
MRFLCCSKVKLSTKKTVMLFKSVQANAATWDKDLFDLLLSHPTVSDFWHNIRPRTSAIDTFIEPIVFYSSSSQCQLLELSPSGQHKWQCSSRPTLLPGQPL